MANYEILNDDIVCIDTEQIRPAFAGCYLIGNAGHHALIETGTSLSVPSILQVLEKLGVPRAAVDYVMPTHVHLDHAGGAGALMEQLPNARLVAHPRAARHLIDPSRLVAGATTVYGEEFMQRMYGRIVPVPEERVLVADVAPGRDFALKLGDRELLFIDAPGHASHHYAVWDARSRGWFTGDVFGASYREMDQDGRPYILPTTTPIDFDPAAWRATLQRILSVDPQWIYLTHYSRVGEPEALAEQLQQGLDTYVRMARELAGQEGGPQRLREGLMDLHLGELRERGCPVPEERVREWLGPDMELNAQGLEVWLQRESRRAESAAG